MVEDARSVIGKLSEVITRGFASAGEVRSLLAVCRSFAIRGAGFKSNNPSFPFRISEAVLGLLVVEFSVSTRSLTLKVLV